MIYPLTFAHKDRCLANFSFCSCLMCAMVNMSNGQGAKVENQSRLTAVDETIASVR